LVTNPAFPTTTFVTSSLLLRIVALGFGC